MRASPARHASIVDLVPCGRCQTTTTTPGELIGHYIQLHRLGQDAAEQEAADQARKCPGCGRRGGITHNTTCQWKDWRPHVIATVPKSAWVYTMATLLPLRVAMRAFRRSYLAHVVHAAGGDPNRITEILGLAPRSIYELALENKLTGVGIAGQKTCSRCRQTGHTSRASRCPKRRRKP